ncbi:autotransporter outer membrane beta-barrel domain-containing protein [Alcanivorax sp. P2S70]|uniref:autotransporter outer membrane beta-barrel domain-containing protein n=1 Tax=Alcanivorax sp. P2S70 TaxID=1397527 RepID=UPI0004B5C1EF|nr:autotransporter outer membrane beta-barrel domain-containing protein [Alcanivorax sp. P2S70]
MSFFNRRHHGGESHAVRAEILCAFGTALAFLLLLPGAASAAADGTDGSGHDGVTGGQGQDGSDGGPFDDGGNGGDGASLVYSDAPAYEASTTTGIDADITDLTSLAGINNGDQLRVTVNGVVTNITINTGDKLIDLAAAIDQIITPFEMSASVTESGSGGDQLIIEGAQNFLDLQITNITGTPISATGINFVNLPGSLGDASRPFSHGGDGGDGGAGSVLSPGDYYFTFDTSGGDGGAGGFSDYFYGNGGNGGNGGAGLHITSAGDRFTLFNGAEFLGGNGGDGGAGGAEGIGGDGGDGGAGIQADASAEITISAGARVVGGDGGQGGTGGSPGTHGIGGYGITGADLDMTLAGAVNPGANQSTAIHFAGGYNRLTLESGYSLGGNVLADGSIDVLALGGDDDGTFDTSVVGVTFQGFEGYEKTGVSNWTLTGASAQDWWVREGTLSGELSTLGGDIRNDAHLRVMDSLGVSDYYGQISGSGDVSWQGGPIFVRNPQTYTGLTLILNGMVNVFSANTFAGDILLDAVSALTYFYNSTGQYDGRISGGGDVNLFDSRIIWTADHDFTGTTYISGSTDKLFQLTLGNGGNTGSIIGDVVFNGSAASNLIIDRGNDYHYDGVISGNGNLFKFGDGNFYLSANHAINGEGRVYEGGMYVNGAMNGLMMSVRNGGLLGGNGSLGNTTVLSGGTLAPGDGLGALTINGNLTLEQGSLLDFQFGAPSGDFSTPGSSDSVSVNGDLAINGTTLTLNDAGSFGPGLYRLFDYTGTLSESNGGLQLANPDSSLTLQYLSGPGQINLLNTGDMTLNFWNANGLASGTTQGGGNGTWTASNSVWADATGTVTGPMIPSPGFAIFAGDAGTVTVSDADGAVQAQGIQFASDGYHVEGDGLTLTGAGGEIRVGDGSAASSGYEASISSVISGSNGLMKTGEGTLVLGGSNDYVGDTVITAGTLRTVQHDALGDASNRLVLDGGAFHVEGAAMTSLFNRYQLALGSQGGTLVMYQDATIRSDLSGTGALIVKGPNTLDLEGSNDFSGGLMIAGGIVQGEVSALGSGFIENNAYLALLDAGQAELGNDLSGSGLINMGGGGEVRLTGNNALFSGDFRLLNGALIGDANAFGSATIENQSRLVLDQAADGIFDNTLSGSGDLEKTGSGAVSLEQDAVAFSGNTVIQQGRVNANSNWSNSTFTVENNAVLGGTGQVGDTTIESGGTLAAGNSIGTLNINGDLTFNSGSQLALEVDPASINSDRIEVSGQANLAGSVLHVGNDGTYQPFSTYTFLNAAGGINGQFDGVTSNYAFLNPVLSYGSNTASLELLRNDLSFASAALTENQRAVALNVDGMPITHSLYRKVLQMSKTQAADAFQAFSGDSLLAGLTAGQQLQQRFAIGMRQRGRNAGGHSGGGMDTRLSRKLQALAAPSNPYAQAAAASSVNQTASAGAVGKRNGVWVQAQSSRFEEDSQEDIGNAAYAFRGDQLALGVDHQWDHWLLGVAAGSADGTLDYDNRQADGDVSSWFAGLYGRWSSAGAWFLRGDLSYGSSDVSQQRMVLGAPAESDSSVKALRVALESGWDLAWGENGLHPYAMVSMTRIERDGFRETGGGIAGLTVDDSELNSGEAWLGADLSRAFVVGGDWLVAEGGLAVVQPFGDTQAEQTARFAGAQQGFTVYGADQDDTQLAANAGAEWFMTADFSLWLGYRGRFGGDTESHGGLLSANLTW